MANVTLKQLPDDLHAQLKCEAEANFRSFTQEAIVRLQRSFDIQDAFSTDTANRMIQEALDSGPEQTFTPEQLAARFEQVKANTRARMQKEKRSA